MLSNGLITISSKNRKVPCPNISLPPIASCDTAIGCWEVCYAMKAYRLYPQVKTAWNKNLATYQKHPKKYFSIITHYLHIHQPEYFRWHSSGDIPDKKYLKGVYDIAESLPDTRFLIFSKRYSWVLSYRREKPDNLSIVLSSWINTEMPKQRRFPVAWYQDGTETRISKNAVTCSGSCYDCKKCWYLKKNDSVIFNKH